MTECFVRAWNIYCIVGMFVFLSFPSMTAGPLYSYFYLIYCSKMELKLGHA